MGIKRQLFLFAAVFSCYLIFSLAFVAAYQTGSALGTTGTQARHAKFILEPVLKMADGMRPMLCDSQGFAAFRAYVENVADFDITGMEAMLEDADQGTFYDVTSAVSCSPREGLIGNQEIRCVLNARELLSRLPSCPFGKPENRFHLSFDISYQASTARVTVSEDIVIADAQARPGMEVKFDVSQPPYPVPEINCKTGSEIDVPVVIHNAETLFGEIGWSFAVNGVQSRAIECGRLLSRSDGGRDDIYACALTVPDTIFGSCEYGSEAEVVISAETDEHKISGNFTTYLTSAELSLSMRLSGIPRLACQIIDEKGTCVPKEPMQNVTATISSNVAEKLRIFEARYAFAGGNMTTVSCKRLSAGKYECPVFVALDGLPVPATKDELVSRSRDLTLFLDVKYLNHYRNVSASTQVSLEGKVISEILSTTNVLKKEKGFLEWITSSKLQKALAIANRVLNLINMCCIGVSFAESALKGTAEQAFKESFREAVMEFLKHGMKRVLLGTAESAFGKVMDNVGKYGPNVLECVTKEGVKDIEKEMQNLQKFEEKKEIPPEDLEIPTIGETIARHGAKCTAKAFWNALRGMLLGIACAIGVIFLIIVTAGGAAAPIKAVCNAVGAVGLTISIVLIALEILILFNTYLSAEKAMTLARERMSVQLNATSILADYNGYFSRTVENTATGLSANEAFMNLTDPSYGMGTVKLMFNTSRTGMLASGDSVCSGDMMTISYDFEKLNLSGKFVPELLISNSHSRTLLFGSLKGAYGPAEIDGLLGVDDPADEPPEEEYLFSLMYGDKKLDYRLVYVSHRC